METASYLKRIRYQGSLQPSIGVLRKLHRRHLLSVPFENLDIHLGKQIILDKEVFYDKIVRDRRGGVFFDVFIFVVLVLMGDVVKGLFSFPLGAKEDRGVFSVFFP